MVYPAQLDNLITIIEGEETLEEMGGIGHAALTNEVNGSLNRVQTTLGINPQGIRSSVAERLALIEGSMGGAPATIDLSAYLHKANGGVVTGATTFSGQLSAGNVTITGTLSAKAATFTDLQADSYKIHDGAIYRSLVASDVAAIPISIQNTFVVNNSVVEQNLSGPLKTTKITATDAVITNLEVANATGVFTVGRMYVNLTVPMPPAVVTDLIPDMSFHPLFTAADANYAVAMKAVSSAMWVETSGLYTGGQPLVAAGIIGPYNSAAEAYGDWTAGASSPIIGQKLNYEGGTTITPEISFCGATASLGTSTYSSVASLDWVSGFLVGKWYLFRPVYRNIGTTQSTVANYRLRVTHSLPGETFPP